jgi:hypothetical protein
MYIEYHEDCDLCSECGRHLEEADTWPCLTCGRMLCGTCECPHPEVA